VRAAEGFVLADEAGGEEAAVEHPSLRLVSARFEQVRGRAAQLFECDDSFRDLCEDYEACATTMARLESGEGSAEMRNEYGALLLRLERELLRYLEEHP
jgi:hypothetical protein